MISYLPASCLSVRLFTIHLNSIITPLVMHFFTNKLFSVNKNLDLFNIIGCASSIHVILQTVESRWWFWVEWMNFNVGCRVLTKKNLEKQLLSWRSNEHHITLMSDFYVQRDFNMTSFDNSFTTCKGNSYWESSKVSEEIDLNDLSQNKSFWVWVDGWN